ncbi:MAG: hypothetical protein QM757_46900 [Paludibaculum sp.]
MTERTSPEVPASTEFGLTPVTRGVGGGSVTVSDTAAEPPLAVTTVMGTALAKLR